MASIGKHLLFSILSHSDSEERNRLLNRLCDAGVTAEMFGTDEEKRAYEYILDYRQRYGVLPSLNLVEVEIDIRFPNFSSEQPFDFWFDEFRRYVKHGILLELVELLEADLSEGRVDSAVGCLGNAYSSLIDLMTEHKSSAKLSELGEPVLEKHNLLQQGLVHEGILTGFPYIDRVTGGAQPGDTWVIAGESGTGKTYIMCRFLLAAVNSGKRCLFISMEMPNLQVGRRAIAMSSHVSSSALRLGRLSRFGVNQVHDFLNTWDAVRDENLLFVEGRVSYSIKDVKAKISEFRPDAVFIDGAYMLRGEKAAKARWEMNVEVLETLKQIAMSENIAIISTFQFDQKSKIKSLATIMGGQAVGQLASVVLGIQNDESRQGYEGLSYKELTLYKGREGETGRILLKYDMNRTMIEEEDVLNGIEDDTGVGTYHDEDSVNIF